MSCPTPNPVFAFATESRSREGNVNGSIVDEDFESFVVTFDGKPQDAWLCPSHPANQALELNALVEIARNYDVAGLHLDYIRYPGKDYCFCAGCRQRFEASLGKPFLFAVYCHAVLGRLVVEGRKRGHPVRLWVDPTRHAGFHQVVKQLTPFFHGNGLRAVYGRV
jgi:hypothetical protein